jgi:linoleoyl-CoA desaturase
MSPNKSISFANTSREFTATLNKRVNDYFKNSGISRHANTTMVIKTIVMFTLYILPYVLIISGIFTNPWIMLMLAAIMGFGMAGIGLSVMHDANHGAYSKKNWVNVVLG